MDGRDEADPMEQEDRMDEPTNAEETDCPRQTREDNESTTRHGKQKRGRRAGRTEKELKLGVYPTGRGGGGEDTQISPKI